MVLDETLTGDAVLTTYCVVYCVPEVEIGPTDPGCCRRPAFEAHGEIDGARPTDCV